MIISQKYHSSAEIDPEFIESLELLMREQVPSFEWIKLKEKSAPKNTHFSYFLFFGEACNSPIGYGQLSIINKESESSLLGFFKKTEKEKEIHWITPSSTGEGLVFNPIYIKDGAIKARSILSEYLERSEVTQQDVVASEELCPVLSDYEQVSSSQLVDALVKNRSSYEEYMDSLSDAASKKVQSLWKEVYKNKDYRIGEYPSFKECFEYKKNGHKQYKELKKDAEIQDCIKVADLYLTFEGPDEIFAFVFMFHGKQGQLFFKTHALEEVEEEILIQAAIMRFYEEEQSDKLRFLEPHQYSNNLQELGFTYKNLIKLKAKDD